MLDALKNIIGISSTDYDTALVIICGMLVFYVIYTIFAIIVKFFGK